MSLDCFANRCDKKPEIERDDDDTFNDLIVEEREMEKKAKKEEKEFFEKYKDIEVDLSTTLEKILSNEKEREVFKEFTEYEHSSENLEFWEVLENLKQETDEKEKEKITKKIMHEFISHDSVYYLNLSDKVRSTTETKYLKKEDDVFHLPLIETLKNLEETFKRFKESSHWRRYCINLVIQNNSNL
jgi:hypothetical protein